jgi:hypothetical protein
MSPILGILASSNYQRVTSAYYSIATTTVGSGGASSVDFTSIPATYTHLQVRYLARGSAVLNEVSIRMRLNTDTGNNYARHLLEGDGSTAAAFATASGSLMALGSIPASTGTASAFGGGVVDILDYANTNKYKTSRSLSGDDRNGGGVVDLASSLWMNTNAVTTVSVFPDSGNFSQYSIVALYGIKGA